MTVRLKEFWNDEAGQGLPEYALLVAAVVVLVVGASAIFSSAVLDLFISIGDYIGSNSPTAT